MTPLVISYINESATPEVRESFEKVFDAFERIGLDTIGSEYESILMTGDDLSIQEVVASLFVLTNNYIADVLSEHGVFLTEEATIEDGAFFISAMLDIPDAECKADILSCITASDNNEERLCEIIALISEKTVEEMLPLVERVSLSCISLIKELSALQEDEYESVIDPKDTARIEQAKLFIQRNSITKLMAVELIQRGVPVGLPYMTYADVYMGEFEKMSPEDAAANMLFMAVISSDSERAMQVVKENLEHYIPNPAFTTKADIALTSLFLAMQNNSGTVAV